MKSINMNIMRALVTALALATLAGELSAQSDAKSDKSERQSESRNPEDAGNENDRDSESESKSGSTKSGEKSQSKQETSQSEQSDKKQTSPSRLAGANRPIDPRAFDEQLLSGLIFDLTNVERSRANLPEFDNNRYLDSAALSHSRDMASRSYFNHKSKGIFNRSNHSDRIKETGYSPRMSAENIAMIPTFNSQQVRTWPNGSQQVVETDYNSYQRLANYSVQQWMNSPGHRANILNSSLTELGVGTAIGMEGNIPYIYLTQNFGG